MIALNFIVFFAALLHGSLNRVITNVDFQTYRTPEDSADFNRVRYGHNDERSGNDGKILQFDCTRNVDQNNFGTTCAGTEADGRETDVWLMGGLSYLYEDELDALYNALFYPYQADVEDRWQQDRACESHTTSGDNTHITNFATSKTGCIQKCQEDERCKCLTYDADRPGSCALFRGEVTVSSVGDEAFVVRRGYTIEYEQQKLSNNVPNLPSQQCNPEGDCSFDRAKSVCDSRDECQGITRNDRRWEVKGAGAMSITTRNNVVSYLKRDINTQYVQVKGGFCKDALLGKVIQNMEQCRNAAKELGLNAHEHPGHNHFEWNIAYRGYTIDIDLYIQTPSECAQACLQNGDCHFWTWGNPKCILNGECEALDLVTIHASGCNMKNQNARSGRQPCDYCVSGAKPISRPPGCFYYPASNSLEFNRNLHPDADDHFFSHFSGTLDNLCHQEELVPEDPDIYWRTINRQYCDLEVRITTQAECESAAQALGYNYVNEPPNGFQAHPGCSYYDNGNSDVHYSSTTTERVASSVAEICRYPALNIVWETVGLNQRIDQSACRIDDCFAVDNLAHCKRRCQEQLDCNVIQFEKRRDSSLNSHCCVTKNPCSTSTLQADFNYDVHRLVNQMPTVVTDILTLTFPNGNRDDCGDDLPNYVRVASWDPVDYDNIDTHGIRNHGLMVICLKYGRWDVARYEEYVTDFIISSNKDVTGYVRIGATDARAFSGNLVRPVFSFFDNAAIYAEDSNKAEVFYFHVQKALRRGANSRRPRSVDQPNGQPSISIDNGPSIRTRYLPGIIQGTWEILYSGNGAGDSHTFTSILTSTDETADHTELANAFATSFSKTEGGESDHDGRVEVGPPDRRNLQQFQFGGIKTVSLTAYAEWSRSSFYDQTSETSDTVANTVAQTVTGSISNGQEVSCTFEAPNHGGAPYSVWVWKVRRLTDRGDETILQTCNTHVKIGPCRDQPPNCIPGFCKDQDCADCLTEDAKIDAAFELRAICGDETSELSCHASTFDSSIERWNCCSPQNPCKLDEGDCDTNDDCEGNLICAQDVGAGYGVSQYLDVCQNQPMFND